MRLLRVFPARRWRDTGRLRVTRLAGEGWAGLEGPEALGGGCRSWAEVHRRPAPSLLCYFPRTSSDEEETALRPEATCPRKPAPLQQFWGQAGRKGPGDHRASSCSPGLGHGPCAEQLRMLLPLFNRKVASPLCWPWQRRGRRGWEREVLASRLWGGRKWQGTAWPKETPRGPALAK